VHDKINNTQHNNDINSSVDDIIAINEWYFITVTYDGDHFSYYKNAVFKKAGSSWPGTITTGAAATSIGSQGGANPLNGKIDDVRIYNRALTDHEVYALYQQGLPGKLGAGKIGAGMIR
jgi:hypothetical protein